MPLGLSFQPGSDQNGGQKGERPGAPPVQQAVKLLGLRLPSVVGAQALSPQALLQSPGSAGVPTGGMSLGAAIDFLRKLMQQSGASEPSDSRDLFSMPSMTGGGSAPSAPPAPRVIPGQQAPGGETPEYAPGTVPFRDGRVTGFSYDALDVPGYQAYQQANSDNPISPLEYFEKHQSY